MKVIVNNPAPAPLPPKTYDLVGITEVERQHLIKVLGKQPAYEPNHTLYTTLLYAK